MLIKITVLLINNEFVSEYLTSSARLHASPPCRLWLMNTPTVLLQTCKAFSPKECSGKAINCVCWWGSSFGRLGIWCTLSLPLFPGLRWLTSVVHIRVRAIVQREVLIIFSGFLLSVILTIQQGAIFLYLAGIINRLNY